MKSELFGMAVLLAILAAAFAGVAGTLAWVRPWVRPSAPAAVLVFEIDADSPSSGQTVDMAQIVPIIHRRINSGSGRLGRVEATDGRLKIEVFAASKETVERVQRLVESSGTFEMRILANRADHAAIIERAKARPETAVRGNDGQPLAWWVPVAPGREGQIEALREAVTRQNTRPGQQALEVLVVNDPFHVTAAHVARATADVDEHGNPAINFTFTSAGARQVEGLTRANLPDPVLERRRYLGVIFNGRLYSAPAIVSLTSDRARVVGGFQKTELDELIRLLDAGALPVRLRKVDSPKAVR